MKKQKYNIEQIHIGDELVYKEKYREGGFPNWKVISKLDESLIVIEMSKGDIKEKRIIELSDITELISHSSSEI
jgi:hypothetical protein